MKTVERIKGLAIVEICGAFPESVLNAAAMACLEMWDVESVDAYTVRAKVFEKSLPALENISARCMCEMRIILRRGGSVDRKLLARRRTLLIFLLLTAVLLLLSSLFIWEINVEGNEKLTTGEILRALEECGVKTGTFWPGLDTDEIRCRMLLRVPELGWMTVNVHGSCADVLISERAEKPEIYDEDDAADIIASKTGIIDSMTVRNGKPAAAPGQAVTAGEPLIESRMDSITNLPRYVRADGSVKARTWYELCAVCPLEREKKTQSSLAGLRFFVKIGKNRINFYIGSRKSIDECDKIVKEYKLGADGLFAMPVSFAAEIYRRPETVTAACADEEGMKKRLLDTLTDSIDGTAEDVRFTVSRKNGVLCVTMRASCLEEIGETRELSLDPQKNGE